VIWNTIFALSVLYMLLNYKRQDWENTILALFGTLVVLNNFGVWWFLAYIIVLVGLIFVNAVLKGILTGLQDELKRRKG
jgi:hypothetical protein